MKMFGDDRAYFDVPSEKGAKLKMDYDDDAVLLLNRCQNEIKTLQAQNQRLLNEIAKRKEAYSILHAEADAPTKLAADFILRDL